MKSIVPASLALALALVLVGCAGGTVHDGTESGDTSDELVFDRFRVGDVVGISRPSCYLVPVTDWPSLERFGGNWVGNGLFAQLTAAGGLFFDVGGWDPERYVSGRFEETTDVIRWTSDAPPYDWDRVSGARVGYTTPARAEYGIGCGSLSGSFETAGALGVFSDDYVYRAATGVWRPRTAYYLYKEIRTDNGATVAHRLRMVRRDDAGEIRTDYMLRR